MCVAEGKCSKWRSQCRWFILIYQVKGTPCTHANIFQVIVISTASLSFTSTCNSDLTESVQSQRLMIEFLSITECVWQQFAHRNRNRLSTAVLFGGFLKFLVHFGCQQSWSLQIGVLRWCESCPMSCAREPRDTAVKHVAKDAVNQAPARPWQPFSIFVGVSRFWMKYLVSRWITYDSIQFISIYLSI